MLLAYKALSTDGKTVSGTIEVASKEDLIASLHRQNLRPLTIAIDKAHHTSGGKTKKVKLQDLVVFTRQLSTMVSAGVPLARSLSALEGDAENPFLREVLSAVTHDVEGGMSLCDAFAKHPTVFNDIYVNMVRAGEEGGILDEILKRLALQVEQDASIRKKIKSAMMYPIVILTITIVSFFGIMLFIVPKIGGILTSLGGPNAKLPIYTQYMLAASNFCVHPTIVKAVPGLNMIPLLNKAPNLIFIMLILAVAAVYGLRYIKTDEGKYKFHALLLRIPIVKIVILKIAISRFARTFASLMGSGVSVLDALDVTGAALGNKVIERELKEAATQVRNGKQLSEPLSKSPHFPPIISQMLMVGEETGQMGAVLVKVADFYDEEVAVMIDGLAAIIEPIMIIFLGAAVGLIAASVMGPIANLSKNISSTN